MRVGARRRSQSGFTLVETLVALAISAIVLGPVGAWMILSFTTQAPTAAGFTDAGQSRLLNTYVTRDVSSSEIVVTDPADLVTCAGLPAGATVLVNLYDLGAEDRLVAFGTAPGSAGGTTSVYRWTCDLTGSHNVNDSIEVAREVVGGATTVACEPTGSPCSRLTLATEFESGHETSVTASRRGSAASLAGFSGTYRPVAVISQTSRVERAAGGQDLEVGLSASSSWDLDTPSGLTFEWSVNGPPGAALSSASGGTTTFSASSAGEYSVVLTVRDPQDNVGSTSMVITLDNKDPSLSQPQCTETAPGSRTFDCSVTADDLDSDDPVTLVWNHPIDDAGTPVSPLPTGVGLTTLTVVFPPSMSADPTVSVTATDTEGGAALKSVELSLGGGTGGPIEISPNPVVSGNGLLARAANTDVDRDVTFQTDPAGFAGWELRDLDTDALVDSATDPVWVRTFTQGTSGRFKIVRLDTLDPPVEREFRINAPPVASFVSPSTTQPAPQTLLFTDASTDDFGLADWEWEFNVGFPAPPWLGSGSSTSYTFDNPGRYNVLLTVTDVDGLSNAVLQPVDVGGVPAQPPPPTWDAGVVRFDPVPGATGYEVTLFYSGPGPSCGQPVSRFVGRDGPFEVVPAPDPDCPDGISAAYAVEANAATGPSSITVPRP